MGNIISGNDTVNTRVVYRQKTEERYNCKVALWHLPYNAAYKDYDEDGSKWFESLNEDYNNEIEKAEKELKMSFTRYKAYSKATKFSDDTQEITTKYPNGNEVTEMFGNNHVFIQIKNKLKRLVAEKIFNHSSNDGMKILYTDIKNGEDTFTIAREYSYDTTKNRSSDIVNYGYTSDEDTLTKGCDFVKEYYLLNDVQVEAEKISDTEYIAKDKNGNALTFKAK